MKLIWKLILLLSALVMICNSEPQCTEEACAYCDLADPTSLTDTKPFCRQCSNELIIQYDATDGASQGPFGGGNGQTGHCGRGLRVKNCYRAPLNDNTRCEICRRGYYLNKDQNECLDLDDTSIDDCVVGHEDEDGWGVICDACLDSMVAPDGKYCIKDVDMPDNCELGARMGTLSTGLGGYSSDVQTYADRFGMNMKNSILGEHLPCFLCGQRFYELHGRCEWSYVEGCKVVDQLNGMCVVCNDFKGYYATGAYYMIGRIYQNCTFRSYPTYYLAYLITAVLIAIIF